MLKNPKILDEFIKLEMMGLLEAYAVEQVSDKFPIQETDPEKILLPVIQELSLEDSKAFYDVIEKELFSEHTLSFSECFELELTKANFKEIA